jgi:TIR domain/Domain of unknown function (DUF4062)/Bacterial regulatory protein, Fis family
MKTSLTVFVCSTYSDLSEERESVLDAIRRLQLQHDSMEFFGARANQPIETCLAEVQRSNILVVIVGHRYGTLVSELGVSFSEAEYAEGYRLKKPCLVYIRDDNVPVLPKHMERDADKLRLLENWKATLQERHTVAAYQGSKDLAVQVAADLSRTISELQEAARTREEARADSPVTLLDEVRELVAEAIKTGATEAALLSSIRRSVSAVVSEAQHLGLSVFLSYANSDREVVRKVAAALSERGIRVWFDESNIKIGSNWLREIERGLDSADFVLFFISPSSVQKGWAQREIQVALHRQVSGERGAVILPILLEHAEVPPLLRNIQWVDMTDGDVDKAVRTIVQTIQYRSARQSENDEGTRIVGKKISQAKIEDVLEEERGVVGAAAKRLGISPKRLYQLLKYYNIQARQFR